MTSFIKNIFSSCLGTLLALTLGILVLIGIGAAIGSFQSSDKLPDQAILSVKLPAIIPERTNNTDISFEKALSDEKVWSIHELVYGIEEAANDEKIKAIIIQPGGSGSPVHMSLIREAIQKFKQSGKPVYTYSEYYGQADYYMASSADKVFLHPIGMIELKGFSLVQPYMRTALENIGVKAEVYYAGDFKSATEPFRSDQMSPENRLQLKELLTEMHSDFVDTLASSRNIDREEVERVIRTLACRSANDAIRLGFADVLGYESDMIDDLKSTLEMEKDDMISVVGFEEYREKLSTDKNYKVKDRIAVVYAEGEIRPGAAEEGMITSDRYIPLLRKIRRDDKVKAVVLRVNSPGGDVFTSDNILKELELIQAAGKPVVASMGDFAASGGYYISMGADSIFASPKTLTGSIGVFALFPNISKLLSDKMEINMDSVTSAPFATFGNITFERSEAEREIFQSFIDSFYITFLDRVAESRDMTRDEVHAIAQGRVWTGNKGLENGLVDKLGDLDDAIAAAASLADLESYRLTEYPKIKSPIMELTEQLEGKGDRGRKILNKQIDQVLPGWNLLQRMLEKGNKGHIEFYLPYQVDWK